MATLSFTYDYPYCEYGETGKYQYVWSESRTKLNGSYTYPLVFNNTVPSCSHITMEVEVENTGAGSVFGIRWDFMVKRSSGSWTDILTFTMPSDGKYTIDCDISNYTITQIAVVPTSNPGSSRTWSIWYGITKLTIKENLTLVELVTNQFQYGVFVNRYGLTQTLNEVYANIGGTLKPATAILVNINGSLVTLPPVYSAHISTSSESTLVYKFTPSSTGTYQIRRKKLSGDHEIRLYSDDFEELSDGFFYNKSISLTAGTLYYITVTHYYNETDTSESYLQIYKEV